MKAIRDKAKELLKGRCRVCRICDGRACAGEMPGIGGAGTGQSFMNNVDSLAKLKLNLRVIHDAKDPDPGAELFGQALSLPVMAAPMGGVGFNMGGGMGEQEFLDALLDGCLQAGTLGMLPDGPHEELMEFGTVSLERLKGRGIPITKPREDRELFEHLDAIKKFNPPALGMDVDTAGFINMRSMGQAVIPRTAAQLRRVVEKAAPLPLVLKGIMTPDEARLAVEAGAAAIVVSNHGGRVLDFTPGTAEVLPAIAREVGGEITILVDGGVRSGVDVLKMLALGAQGVLIGRPLIIAAMGGGAEGVAKYLELLKHQLISAMLITGCKDLASVGPHILWNPND